MVWKYDLQSFFTDQDHRNTCCMYELAIRKGALDHMQNAEIQIILHFFACVYV